ncbi:MAG: M1 family metallopeptidase [Acidimicrobiia bacterium]|nr:M1 family metallopeptidase [Acidimicrobiia bacterium]
MMTDPSYRLPRQVVPRHYRLRMEPDLDSATFAGSEVVTLDVVEATDRVELNAAELRIDQARFVRSNASAHAEVEYDEELQRATLLLAQPLSAGRWELHCRFSGILNDQLRGFYLSTFDDEDGNEQVIATTQFEATDARRALPCWDEPDFKASFGVTLVVPEDLMAVSTGAEIERESLGDGRVAITFAETIVMSTYLVAFVVGPFEATPPADVNGVPLRIVAPRGKMHLTGFALECSRFCLDYLATYYGIPYPGDKVDMVAIPDFAFGAMENLGCITYRESVLLVDDELATSAEKMRILDVIGHELAHMWFGDLVTMKWWNGIWLNEAFATFMESPGWKRWLEFAAAERPWAFKTDELAGTRPVEFEVRSPAQAEGMFDGITYGKGSAVLRMMEQYLGEEPFRAGVESYLRRHAYGNTETSDLWESLDGSSGRPVGEIMDTWILQGGYPQLTVRAEEGGVSLEQGRFLLIPDPADTSTWKIPVQLRGMAGGEPFETGVLVEGSRVTVPLGGPVDWVIANAGGHGFYRSRYEEPLLDALVDRLHLLDPVERFVLVDDAWTFVEAGRSGVSGFVSLASAFRDEQEQAVWGALLGAIASIGHHLVTASTRPRYERWVAGLLAPLADQLGWAPAAEETDLVRRLRGRVIDSLGRLAKLPEVVEQARSIHEQRVAEPTSVDPEVAGAVISVCAAHGDAETYERFLDRHRAVRNPQESLKYLRALASFDAEDAVDRTFELIVDRTVRNQDTSWVLARMLANRTTGPYARLDAILEIIPPMTQSRIADGFPALSHPEVAAEVTAFLAENPLPNAAKAVEQKLERLSALVKMRERETGAIAGALPE